MFAVTTGLPDFSAVRIRRRAGSTPPMTSTTTSMSGSLDDRVGVVGEHAGRELDVALLGHVVHGDPADLELDPGALRDEVGVRVEQAHERGAHVPAAQESHPHDVRHPAILADRPTRPEPIGAQNRPEEGRARAAGRAELVEAGADRADSDESRARASATASSSSARSRALPRGR